MRYFIEVISPGTSGTRVEVHIGSASLGTGADDEVHLTGGSIAGPRALRLNITEGGVELTARDSACNFTYQGKLSESCQLAWGEEIYLGTTRLAFVVEETRQTKTSPLLLVVAIFGLLFAVGGVIRLSDNMLTGATAPAPPALTPGPSACRATTLDAALESAEQTHALATAKAERYPFHRADGVLALELYLEASSCFAKAKLHDKQKQVQSEYELWSERIDRDLRDLRLRLNLALREDDTSAALDSVEALQSMLEHISSRKGDSAATEYQRWLSVTEQRLRARRR